MKDASEILKEINHRQVGCSPSPWPRRFVLSAGGILAMAGASNILDLFGKSQVLDLSDPVLAIPIHYVLLLLGLAELLAGWICLFTNRFFLSFGFAVGLPVVFMMYRFKLRIAGWPHPWIFVGGYSGMLNISPLAADYILAISAAFLYLGSLLILLFGNKVHASLKAKHSDKKPFAYIAQA